jgi:hypothetical protein
MPKTCSSINLVLRQLVVTLAPSNDHSAFEMLINNATPVQILGLYS